MKIKILVLLLFTFTIFGMESDGSSDSDSGVPAPLSSPNDLYAHLTPGDESETDDDLGGDELFQPPDLKEIFQKVSRLQTEVQAQERRLNQHEQMAMDEVDGLRADIKNIKREINGLIILMRNTREIFMAPGVYLEVQQQQTRSAIRQRQQVEKIKALEAQIIRERREKETLNQRMEHAFSFVTTTLAAHEKEMKVLRSILSEPRPSKKDDARKRLTASL